MLAEAGATGNEKDDIGATPVHDAAEQGQLGSLKLLAHYGADLATVDSDDLTPRKLAIDRGHHDCGQFLAMALARQSAARSVPLDDESTPASSSGGEAGGVRGGTAAGVEAGGGLVVPSGNPAHSSGAYGHGFGSGGGGDLEHLQIKTGGGEAVASPSSSAAPVLSPKEQAKAEKKRLKEQKALQKKAKKEAAAEAKRLKKMGSKPSKGSGSSSGSTSIVAEGAPETATPSSTPTVLPGSLGMTGLSSKALSGTHPAHVAVFKSESIRRKEGGSRPAVLDLWESQLQEQAQASP